MEPPPSVPTDSGPKPAASAAAVTSLTELWSLTMVVPPALAYGETGYPPKVPPNATMVYELRIDNSQAPAKGVSMAARFASTRSPSIAMLRSSASASCMSCRPTQPCAWACRSRPGCSTP